MNSRTLNGLPSSRFCRTSRVAFPLICPTGRSRMGVMRNLPVVPLCRRRAVLLETPNQHHPSCIPPHQEGRIAIVTDVERGMRWTQRCRETSDAEADGKDVWSWRPDAGAKFLRSKLLRDDGGKRARSPGRARYKPLKPLRREGPDDPAPPVVTTVCFLPTHTGRGCELSTRSSLRPLILEGKFRQQLGRYLRRENVDV